MLGLHSAPRFFEAQKGLRSLCSGVSRNNTEALQLIRYGIVPGSNERSSQP